MVEFFISHINLIAQILGFIAMGMGILVYQFNRHSTIMFIKVCISAIWCIHYGLLGLWSAVAINVLNVVRDTIFALREKKKLETPIIPVFFVVVSVVSVLCTWGNWWSIVPMIASVTSTLAHWQKVTKKLKIYALPGNILWLIYDLFNKSWSGSANDAFVIGSIIVSLVRIRVNEKKENLHTEVENNG